VRLFPVLGLAFGLAYAHACVVAGRWVDPHWVELLGNCFFLQDFVPVKPGAWVNPYWGNAALWSLSYEWWFYVGYAALRSRVPERNRLTWVASISLAGLAVLAWRPIAPAYWSAYFIIWWAGATWGQREGENGLVWRQRWWTLACLGFATLCAAGLVGRWSGALRPGTFPVLILRHFAAALVLVVLAFATRRMNPASLSRWVRIGLPIAPFSYALYVMHTPVAAQEPWISGFSGWGAALVMGAVAVSVSWWAETIYHPWAARGLNRARAWFGGDQG
jgi:peptidoglycan/LPS O-acetylase OafA/YrhL